MCTNYIIDTIWKLLLQAWREYHSCNKLSSNNLKTCLVIGFFSDIIVCIEFETHEFDGKYTYTYAFRNLYIID